VSNLPEPVEKGGGDVRVRVCVCVCVCVCIGWAGVCGGGSVAIPALCNHNLIIPFPCHSAFSCMQSSSRQLVMRGFT